MSWTLASLSPTRFGRPSVEMVVAALALVASGLGCSPPRATMVAKLPDPVVMGAEAERFELTPANTVVEAEVSAAATFTISFHKLAGTLEMVVAEPEQSRFHIDIEMGGASSSPDIVAEIAMSPNFIDAAKFPTASFDSRRVETNAEGHYEMIGELTLHGVTRGLRMPIELTVNDCRVQATVAFSFDRHEFAIQNEDSMESLVADTVAVRFVLDLARAPRAGVTCPPS